MTIAKASDPGANTFQVDEFYLDLQEEGKKVRMLSGEEITQRPFPGLRPYKTSEFQLYNGRVGQSEELIKRLSKNRFLAVIGSSGTGKSSLVRAGLIPQLFGGYLHEAGSKWDIAICRPGKDPVENLTVALASILSRKENPTELRENFEKFEPLLSNSVFGLLDAKEMLDKVQHDSEKQPANLLVIIDQFEELFRFNRKDLGKENIENQFVNLLLKAAKDPKNPIYVIITMRSEFLGDSVKYRGLPEAINEGQYLVPQLTRDDLKAVIQNPISLAGKKISPSLVELLINEIEESKLRDNLDQLPILQHALMRTYQEAMKEGPNTEIVYRHYKAIGEMDKALAKHAESIFTELGNNNNQQDKTSIDTINSLGENEFSKISSYGSKATAQKTLSKKQQIAKLVFQSLTDMGSNQKGGRRPTELENIHATAASMNASPAEVDEVINRFRDTDTSFIMPPRNTELNPNLIVDISHESLMRNWTILNNWIIEEKKAGNLYELLNDRRELHEHDPGDWLRGLLLNELLDWKNEHPNSPTWASRYHTLPEGSHDDIAMHKTLYDKNMYFLEGSRLFSEKQAEERRKEIKEKIELEQREQSNKKRLFVYTIAAVISLMFGGLALFGFVNALKQTEIAKKQTEIANDKTKLAQRKTTEAESERKIALYEKRRADSKSEEAKKSADTAMQQRDYAEVLRKKALKQSKLMEEQNKLLAKFTAKALEAKGLTENQNQKFQQQLVVNILKKQPFYFSDIAQETKEDIIEAVLIDSLPPLDEKLIPLKKYTDTTLLMYFNEVSGLNQKFKNNPAGNITSLQKIWANNQHPILKKLILNIVNEHIVAKESMAVAPSIDISEVNSAVAQDGQGFVFSNANQLITGRSENGKLLLDERSFDNQLSWIKCKIKMGPSENSTISAITFTNNHHFELLVDSNKININPDWKLNNRTDTLFKLPREIRSIKLSPDEQHAFIIHEKGNALIWNGIGTQQKIDTIGNYRNDKTDGFFSPDGKFLFFNVNGKARMRSIDKKKEIGISDWEEEKIKAAAFVPDGNDIVVLNEHQLSIRDSSLSPKEKYSPIDIKQLFLSSSLAQEEITSISISPKLKRMLINMDNGKVFLLEESYGYPLFSPPSLILLKYRLKPLENGEQKIKATFYNDSTVISIDEMGLVKLWPVYQDFSDLETAFMNLQQKKPETQKRNDEEITYQQLLVSASNTELNIAADKCAKKFYWYTNPKSKNDFYRGKEYLDTLELIYQKLNDGTQDEMHLFYLAKLIEITNKRMDIDRFDINPSGNQRDYDIVYRYRAARAKKLKERIELQNQQVSRCPLNKTYNEDLSTSYGSLSYSQLYVQDFNGVITSAKAGLLISPQKNDWIYTNLALGYLLSGQYKSALEIYNRYKDKIYTDRRKDFKSAFLTDIADLENAGVFKSLDPKIISDITAIQNLLKTPAAIKK